MVSGIVACIEFSLEAAVEQQHTAKHLNAHLKECEEEVTAEQRLLGSEISGGQDLNRNKTL